MIRYKLVISISKQQKNRIYMFFQPFLTSYFYEEYMTYLIFRKHTLEIYLATTLINESVNTEVLITEYLVHKQILKLDFKNTHFSYKNTEYLQMRPRNCSNQYRMTSICLFSLLLV